MWSSMICGWDVVVGHGLPHDLILRMVVSGERPQSEEPICSIVDEKTMVQHAMSCLFQDLFAMH